MSPHFLCGSEFINFLFSPCCRAFIYFSSPVPKELLARIKGDTSVLPRISALREVQFIISTFIICIVHHFPLCYPDSLCHFKYPCQTTDTQTLLYWSKMCRNFKILPSLRIGHSESDNIECLQIMEISIFIFFELFVCR